MLKLKVREPALDVAACDRTNMSRCMKGRFTARAPCRREVELFAVRRVHDHVLCRNACDFREGGFEHSSRKMFEKVGGNDAVERVRFKR